MRNITSAMAVEFSSKSLNPVIMADLEFDSGTLRLWSGYGNFTWNGEVYTGAGNLIGISSVQETQDIEARGLVCTLNGISSTIISLALNEKSRGRKFKLYLAAVSSNYYVATEDEPGAVLLEDGSGYVTLENDLVDSPYRIYSGLMDVMEFTDNGTTADIKLSVENNLIIAQRPKISRYTPEDQRKRFPSDKGLEFINQLQDKEIVW